MTVCFLSSVRYTTPLDETEDKKFEALARGQTIRVIGFAAGLRPRRFERHARFYLLPRLPIGFLRYLTLLFAGAWLALWCIFRQQSSILVAQSPYEGVAAAWAKTCARLMGRRVALVVESHGDFEVSVFLQRRVFFPRLYRSLMRLAAGYALARADVLRAVSKATSRQLRKWAPQPRIFEFPAWTDIGVFLDANGETVDSRAQRVLFAGLLFRRKGVHHLVSAFAQIAPQFPRAELVIVGREENKAYVKELKREVARLGLVERVEFVGEVPQQELAGWMHRSLVFVLPSLSEGLGRVVVEAMATGTPVIGSRVDGIPDLIQDGKTGFLVPPEDVSALSNRLRSVLNHPDETRQMGRAARSFAEEYFSTEAYLRSYGELFEAAQSLCSCSH